MECQIKKSYQQNKLKYYCKKQWNFIHKLKTYIVNSAKSYIHSAIFPQSHKVYHTAPPSPSASEQKMQPWWHDLVHSLGLMQWLPHIGFSLTFQLSIPNQIFAFSFLSLPPHSTSFFVLSLTSVYHLS